MTTYMIHFGLLVQRRKNQSCGHSEVPGLTSRGIRLGSKRMQGGKKVKVVGLHVDIGYISEIKTENPLISVGSKPWR